LLTLLLLLLLQLLGRPSLGEPAGDHHDHLRRLGPRLKLLAIFFSYSVCAAVHHSGPSGRESNSAAAQGGGGRAPRREGVEVKAQEGVITNLVKNGGVCVE